jgi:hypothetical protein
MSELQQTDEWIKARLGKVTASRMGDIMAKTKSGPSASRKNVPKPGRGGPWEWDKIPIRPDEYGYGPTSLATRVHPAAWDAWLRGLPESENIEDRRGTPGYIGYRPEWK